jgi:hypothetical protein
MLDTIVGIHPDFDRQEFYKRALTETDEDRLVELFVEYLQSIKVEFLHDITVEDIESFHDRSAAYRAIKGAAISKNFRPNKARTATATISNVIPRGWR